MKEIKQLLRRCLTFQNRVQLRNAHPTQRRQTLDFIHNGSKVVYGHSRQLQQQILCSEVLAGVDVFFPRASAGGLEEGREGGTRDE